MDKSNKAIVVFYVVLFVGVVFTLLYIDSNLDRPFRELNLAPTPVSEVKFSKTVDIDREKIFDTFAGIENYPYVLPNNVLSVTKVSDQESVYDIVVIEQGIKTSLKIKHSATPYDSQTIQVLDGDAQGTTIQQHFSKQDNMTIISTDVELKTRGVLTPFSFLPVRNINHAIDTIVSTFVDYSKRPYNENEKIVDDLYREILLRPADSEGLRHFSELLANEKITVNEIRSELLNSEEYKSKFLLTDMKPISEISEETNQSLNELYNIALRRDADPRGMQYFGSALENEKMTKRDIVIELLTSDEFKSLPAETREVKEAYMSNEYWQTVNQTYYEIHGKYPTKKTVRAYGIFFEKEYLSLDDIRNIFQK